LPYIACTQLASGVKATFVNLWRHAVQTILAARPTWTLRDYHSPNLIWLAGRQGIASVGIIDFQDCVLGHAAYDVVSLLQDARIDVPQDVELRLLSYYARLRRDADTSFDTAGFARAYAILGAQRATKILGIFARLDERDQKPQYLVHLPRVERYLAKNLGHPALAEIKYWYEEHLPSIFGAAP
jgi:aminoglycoside/choline kinase family phosphotransferase